MTRCGIPRLHPRTFVAIFSNRFDPSLCGAYKVVVSEGPGPFSRVSSGTRLASTVHMVSVNGCSSSQFFFSVVAHRTSGTRILIRHRLPQMRHPSTPYSPRRRPRPFTGTSVVNGSSWYEIVVNTQKYTAPYVGTRLIARPVTSR